MPSSLRVCHCHLSHKKIHRRDGGQVEPRGIVELYCLDLHAAQFEEVEDFNVAAAADGDEQVVPVCAIEGQIVGRNSGRQEDDITRATAARCGMPRIPRLVPSLTPFSSSTTI